MEYTNSPEDAPKETKTCPDCRKEISIDAKRCRHCQADLRNWLNRHPFLSFILIVICGLFILSLAGGSNSNSTSSSNGTDASTNSAQSSAEQLSESTGISVDDINAAYPIAARYGLDSETQDVVVQQAADLYGIETQTSSGAALQQAGVGSFDDITDTLSHLVSTWSVSDTDVATSSSALFSAITNGSISWGDLTNALITNGPKMSKYISLGDAAIQLEALSQIPTLSSATIIDTFNSIGDSVQDPTTPMNQYLGGTGSVRTLLGQQNGLINTFQKISKFLQSQQGVV